MKIDDLAACFEGIYPSVLATRGPDGMPNVTYLSHVAQVDERHVAISNQFFAKTAANIRSDPRATLLLVDPQDGAQYHLKLIWTESTERGALFDAVEAQLRASSAQVGLSDVMRLRALDLFRVEAIVPLAAEGAAAPDERADDIGAPALPTLSAAVGRMSALTDSSQLICELLDTVHGPFAYDYAMVLLSDADRAITTAVASVGYGAVVAGAEVAHGVGLIGAAAERGQSMRINDLSRVRRLGRAVLESSTGEEAPSRQVALPGAASSLSQIAVPMRVQGQTYGILFVESDRRLAFDRAATAALEILANHLASLLALNEQLAVNVEPGPVAPRPVRASAGGRPIAVVHHGYDESIFVDNAYVIKGLPGRLLAYMLDRHAETRQDEFSNRELRLAMASVLPDFKDNLETRLLLLRRRLDDLGMPIRLQHVARGRLRLTIAGEVAFTRAS